MAPIELVMVGVVAGAALLAFIASVKVIRNHETIARTLGQLAFTWLVPFIGPLVTMHLLRREHERAPPCASDAPPEVDGKVDQRPATTFSRGGGRRGAAEDSEAETE